MDNPSASAITDFWSWFSAHAETIADGTDNHQHLDELDRRILNLASGLSWEIGPGHADGWQLTISPNLDRDFREAAKSIIANAPQLQGWEFHSARQLKDWNYLFEFETEKSGKLSVNASNWQFALLKYPDGVREILLKAAELPDLTEGDRWQACAIALESILGEEILINSIDTFELATDFGSLFTTKWRPIQQLRSSIAGMSQEC